MKLDHVITRTELTFGTDAIPTDALYLDNDNVFFAPQYGPNAEPLEALAVAYSAPVAAPDVVLNFYLWDEETTTWYLFGNVNATWTLGDVHWVTLPNIIDRKDSRAQSRMAVAVVAAPGAPLPAGDYRIGLASSTSSTGEETIGWLAIIAALLGSIDINVADIETLTTNIDTNISDIEVLATNIDTNVADIETLATNIDTNVADIETLLTSIDGKIANPMPVVGVDADDAPATANAVGIGGKYIADPFASPLSADGDFGEALINQIRMLVTEDRVYDPATDANKEVPVWTQADRGDVMEVTGSAAVDGSTYYYIDMLGFGYFSCEFLPNAATGGAACTIDLSYQVSDEESQPDITARSYVSDMSVSWFGAASYSSGAGGATTWAHEKDTTTGWSSIRLKVTVDNYVAGSAVPWTIRFRKIAM
jgi:hypothetical protein